MPTQTATRPQAAGGPIGAVADPEADGKKAKKGKKGGKDGEAKSGKKKKMIILLVIVLVIGGVGYKMMAPSKPAKPAPPKPGAVIAMTDTTLNLTDGHFLKIKIALQTIAGAPADLDTSKAADLMISEFTGQTMATLSTADGRNKLKDELLTKIETAYPKQILDLYFTEFVMQ